MIKKQAIIFDMDGLIFDTEKVYHRANKEAAKTFGIPYNDEIFYRFIGSNYQDVINFYHQEFDSEFGEEQVNSFILEADRLVEEYFRAGLVETKPGLYELLDFLDQKEIPRIIASSSSAQIIELLLDRSDLKGKFQAFVSSDDVKRAKPDPEIFELASQKLGLAKEEILILEDSKNGILAANQAGIDVIMVPDIIEADDELRDLTEAVLLSLDDLVGLWAEK
ncbi:HAD family phosphatase [Streptococcaceae bacterium ESL0729]|nr:HAD family phosphatase [Streptococcaceae bacterium ESL0729]